MEYASCTLNNVKIYLPLKVEKIIHCKCHNLEQKKSVRLSGA